LHHKKLTRIMAEFADDLDKDLKDFRQTMSDQTRAANTYFDGVKSHADQLKTKLQSSMESISKEVKVGKILKIRGLVY